MAESKRKIGDTIDTNTASDVAENESGGLKKRATIRTQKLLDFWKNNWDAVYKHTRSNINGIGITTCCYLSVRIILLYFGFKKTGISLTEKDVFTLFLELTTSSTTHHRNMIPLIDFPKKDTFTKYYSENQIQPLDCAQYIRQISNQQNMNDNLVEASSIDMMPDNYYIGVIMYRPNKDTNYREPNHWYVYYLSSDTDYVNIISTWGTDKWGIIITHNTVLKTDYDAFVANINSEEVNEQTKQTFSDFFLNPENAFAYNKPENALTKISQDELNEGIETELQAHTIPGNSKIMTVFPYYYGCLLNVIEQLKVHIKPKFKVDEPVSEGGGGSAGGGGSSRKSSGRFFGGGSRKTRKQKGRKSRRNKKSKSRRNKKSKSRRNKKSKSRRNKKSKSRRKNY
jgi:hypothetical protein